MTYIILSLWLGLGGGGGGGGCVIGGAEAGDCEMDGGNSVLGWCDGGGWLMVFKEFSIAILILSCIIASLLSLSSPLSPNST